MPHHVESTKVLGKWLRIHARPHVVNSDCSATVNVTNRGA